MVYLVPWRPTKAKNYLRPIKGLDIDRYFKWRLELASLSMPGHRSSLSGGPDLKLPMTWPPTVLCRFRRRSVRIVGPAVEERCFGAKLERPCPRRRLTPGGLVEEPSTFAVRQDVPCHSRPRSVLLPCGPFPTPASLCVLCRLLRRSRRSQCREPLAEARCPLGCLPGLGGALGVSCPWLYSMFRICREPMSNPGGALSPSSIART